jgi:hypothetical protein
MSRAVRRSFVCNTADIHIGQRERAPLHSPERTRSATIHRFEAQSAVAQERAGVPREQREA